MSGAILVVALFLGIAFTVGLYVLVRAEHGKRERMDRESAERVARRDTDDDR